MQLVTQQIRAFIKDNSPNDAAMTDFINNLVPAITPQHVLHRLKEKPKEPLLVYAHLMVQDIRDPYYFYSFIMKRPFKADEKFLFFRWGNQPQELAEDPLESQEYLKVMLDRDPVMCTSIPGLTPWAQELEGHQEQIQLVVDNKNNFKLGEIINVVAYYHSDHNKLYFVRRATPEQIEKQNLEPLNTLNKKEIDYENVRKQLLSFFSSCCSPTFAEQLILCLISDDPIFLGADADISPLIEAVYPRVKHLKLVHPCEDSLFPWKNQEGQMISAPLQLSSLPTFVSIDLSDFSSKNVIQVGEKTINNFKALKVFVEENKTIYRWEYGESLVDHPHRGVVVKATSLITPHFNPKDQNIIQEFSVIQKTPKELLSQFRQYLVAVRSITPTLFQEERIKIEDTLKTSSEKEKIGQKLSKIMQFSKLIARSHGRSGILLSDYNDACHLIEQEVPPKSQ